MEPDVKLRTLALREASLRTVLGNGNPFRWMRRPLTQGYIPKNRGDIAIGGGTSSVRTRIISRISPYTHTEGAVSWEKVRMDIEVLDLDPLVAASTATTIQAFLRTVNLMTGQQFGSPITTPNNFPTYVGNRRQGEEPQPGPLIFVELVDIEFFNDTLT